jgi:hypothetical protein
MSPYVVVVVIIIVVNAGAQALVSRDLSCGVLYAYSPNVLAYGNPHKNHFLQVRVGGGLILPNYK